MPCHWPANGKWQMQSAVMLNVVVLIVVVLNVVVLIIILGVVLASIVLNVVVLIVVVPCHFASAKWHIRRIRLWRMHLPFAKGEWQSLWRMHRIRQTKATTGENKI